MSPLHCDECYVIPDTVMRSGHPLVPSQTCVMDTESQQFSCRYFSDAVSLIKGKVIQQKAAAFPSASGASRSERLLAGSQCLLLAFRGDGWAGTSVANGVLIISPRSSCKKCFGRSALVFLCLLVILLLKQCQLAACCWGHNRSPGDSDGLDGCYGDTLVCFEATNKKETLCVSFSFLFTLEITKWINTIDCSVTLRMFAQRKRKSCSRK